EVATSRRWQPLDGDILVDMDMEGTDAEELGWGAQGCPPHVEIGEDGAPKLLVEGVDVGLEVGVVEGEFPFVTVQLHPDPFEVPGLSLGAGGVGSPAELPILPRQAVNVPKTRTCIVVESPRGVTPGPGHPNPPVHAVTHLHLPDVETAGEAAGAQEARGGGGVTHLVVFGDGLVGSPHGPEILCLLLQVGVHVLQLGLRGGDSFSTLGNLCWGGSHEEKKQEPQ
ncbi:hypothetical protein N300_02219, partial [Calypte anna]